MANMIDPRPSPMMGRVLEKQGIVRTIPAMALPEVWPHLVGYCENSGNG